MYSRNYEGRTVRFEPSGGLVNSSLIMQDKETDTYWSIMEGEAVAGELDGTKLVELPVGEKMQWRHWREKHPDTLVISVDGREDAPNAYVDYFSSPRGFAGQAKDDRLPTKTPVYAFHEDGVAYAVPHEAIENGKVVELKDGRHVFMYRKRGISKFRSTAAYVSGEGFERREGVWVEKGTGDRFDPEEGAFSDDSIEPLPGFDTFWYTWSLNNPGTKLLG